MDCKIMFDWFTLETIYNTNIYYQRKGWN